jgi:hypothetical protein
MEVGVGGVIIITSMSKNDNANYPIGTNYYYDIVSNNCSRLWSLFLSLPWPFLFEKFHGTDLMVLLVFMLVRL